ncbi:MAG TPA: ThuA domain-containing protein [Acidimicrobiales bacterium]|jgi:type 1 glutamine amidotransferase|nr:ThuA domain-containing protein [Acidimicrobiales bacterium]
MADTMLIVTQVAPYVDGPAGVHGTLSQAQTALSELADMAGLAPTVVTDVRDVSPQQVSTAGVLALFTIGETPWSPAQKEAAHSAWSSGRLRVLGVHSATDANHTWPEYGAMLGGRFDGHPWTQDFIIDVVDTAHPATAHIGEQWDWHDEVYLFRDLRPDARVLLRLADDQVDLSVSGGRVPDCGFPLAWCVEDGAARSFYTALGHFHLAWELPVYLRHLAGGLAWLRESA